MSVHLAVAGEVLDGAGKAFDGVLFCAIFLSYEMSWMRSGTEMSQFLRIFLPTLSKMIEYKLLNHMHTFISQQEKQHKFQENDMR